MAFRLLCAFSVLVVALSQFGKGMVRALSYLIALVAGTALSMVFGMADFSGVASKPWFGLPQIMPYGGFDFDAAVFVPFFIGRRSRVLLQFDSGWGVLCGDSQGTADRPAESDQSS